MITLVQGSIQPVTVYPDQADTLIGDSFYGCPPQYRWQFCQTVITKGTPAKGKEGDPDYVAATDDTSQVVMLTQGNGNINQKQWDNWTTQPDETYLLQCIANNQKVTLL